MQMFPFEMETNDVMISLTVDRMQPFSAVKQAHS
jgi:hypothetical protein